MLSILSLFLTIYLLLRLPHWLDALSLWHCGMNWLHYRHWTPCRHPRLHAVWTPIEMGDVGAIVEYPCAACGITLLTDMLPHVRFTPQDHARLLREQARVEYWHARQDRLRDFLARWVLPPLQEYGRFCRFVGFWVITSGLILWLMWGTVGEPFLTATLGSPSCRQIRLEMFFLEADKQSPCWSPAPDGTVSQHWKESHR
jgi:hypothetical protein